MKKILVLSASLYTCPVLQKLVEGGFHVLLVDMNPESPGKSHAHQFKPIDIKDALAVTQWAREENIDGVMAINDAGTRTASFVAKELGLAGLDPEVVELGNDKGLMRDRWAKDNLPMPGYRVIHSYEELQQATRSLKLPQVLKPTDCDGSGKGISVIRSEDDLRWSFDFATPFAKNGRYIVEEFVDGIEMTIECFSYEKQVHILAMSDKVKPDLRTRVATSLNYTADFPDEVLDQVIDLVKKAVLSIGVFNGFSHTELIVSPEGPKLVEIGVRPGGGFIYHTIIEAVSGINAPVLFGKFLTGQTVDINEIQRRGAVYRFFNPTKGILKSVKNLEEARNVEGVLALDIVKKKGDVVGDLKNSLERAGFIITRGRNRQEAVAAADKAESLVEFEVEPLA